MTSFSLILVFSLVHAEENSPPTLKLGESYSWRSFSSAHSEVQRDVLEQSDGEYVSRQNPAIPPLVLPTRLQPNQIALQPHKPPSLNPKLNLWPNNHLRGKCVYLFII